MCMNLFVKNIVVLSLLLFWLLGNQVYSQSLNKKNTYKIGDTEYISGETYTSTGQPKVKRSISARNQFLKNKGYSKIPRGYQVDHIIPLSKGGKDTSYNMQLISIEQHKIKTANERKPSSGGGYYKYNSYYKTPAIKTTTGSFYKHKNTGSYYNLYKTPVSTKSYKRGSSYKIKPYKAYKTSFSSGRRRK